MKGGHPAENIFFNVNGAKDEEQQEIGLQNSVHLP
jgi:hypothetical protein